jgi:hypothetical protein
VHGVGVICTFAHTIKQRLLLDVAQFGITQPDETFALGLFGIKFGGKK